MRTTLTEAHQSRRRYPLTFPSTVITWVTGVSIAWGVMVIVYGSIHFSAAARSNRDLEMLLTVVFTLLTLATIWTVRGLLVSALEYFAWNTMRDE